MKLLLIEDDPRDAELLKSLLRETERNALLTETSLERAFQKLRETDIDLILLDLTLPDVTGLEAFIKLAERAPEMPVIVLSPFENEELGLHAVQEGAQDFMVKGTIQAPDLHRRIVLACGRNLFQKKLIRLASFAWQNPNAIIETDEHGKIIYINPSGSRQFPEIQQTGMHPFLTGLARIVTKLQEEKRDLVVREIQIRDQCYEQHIFYVPGTGVVRSYITDVTEKKRAEEKLRARTSEVERMNRLMVGRELKMKELKLKIALLTAQLKGPADHFTAAGGGGDV